VVLPPETFPGAIWINVLGIVLAIAMLAPDWTRSRARKDADAIPATRY
jgi:hypothetical protein